MGNGVVGRLCFFFVLVVCHSELFALVFLVVLVVVVVLIVVVIVVVVVFVDIVFLVGVVVAVDAYSYTQADMSLTHQFTR